MVNGLMIVDRLILDLKLLHLVKGRNDLRTKFLSHWSLSGVGSVVNRLKGMLSNYLLVVLAIEVLAIFVAVINH